ncbi:MAG: hypothetical protein QOF30_1439 [Acidimicrobiaceae bacterium]|jgi:hypothetical protein|nr:hypothetical protein [Acidimicrobiaceae bacterium]
MAPAAVGTLVVTAVLVAGLAIYLIMIATNLQKISAALDVVLGAVTGIAGQVKPAPGVVGSIARDVGAIQGALHGLIALATGGAAPAPAAPAAPSRSSARAAAAPAPSGRSRPNLPPPVHRRH